MILVVGATGLVGMEVVRTLAAAGKSVRALVRPGSHPDKVEAVRRGPATPFAGDLKQPVSLQAACEGVDTVISTASATLSSGAGDSIDTVDRDGQLALLDTARQRGVRHFIYVSFSGNIDYSFPLRDAKRAVEQRLKESGLTCTIVRPSFFMEVWLGSHLGFDPSGGSVRIFGSGDQGISFISLADVAAYVAGSVDNPAVSNQTIELGGPEPVSYHRATELFERALDRAIARHYVPTADLEQQLAAATDPMQKTFAGLMLAAALGDAIDPGPALEKVPIPLTSVESFVARTAGVLKTV